MPLRISRMAYNPREWKMEDGGWRIAVFNPRSSILGLHLMMMLMRVAATMLAVAKNQRLDHHRHRLGIGQFLADVHKVKVPEIDAVDGNYSGTWQQLAFDNIAHQLGNIRIEDQHQGLALVHMFFHGVHQSFRKRPDQGI